MLYSYLGSAGEIDPAAKTFAVSRLLAADVLLDGYVEMLASALRTDTHRHADAG